MKTPKNTFEKVMMYPKALDELKIHELEIAKDEGIEWLKEIDRLLNDAIDTVDRNYQRLGQIDELGLPTGSGYAKEIQNYSDWHKKAKKQAESVLLEIDKKILGDVKIDIQRLQKIVLKANDLLHNHYQKYKPLKSGAFISNDLKNELAEEFSIGATTVYDDLKLYCDKENRFYKIKPEYKVLFKSE